jgi:hypothetical protein
MKVSANKPTPFTTCTTKNVAMANQMHPAPGYLSNTTPVVDGQYGMAQGGYSGA